MTKTKKRTDAAGAVTSTTLVDPWGGEVVGAWVENPTQQKRKFTTYERDANNRDEAQQRGYSAWFSRFDQPDPWDGSYDLTDPQSLNRYAYTQSDPVNFVDPSGLLLAPFITSFCRGGDCYSFLRWDSISGFGGSGLDPFDSPDPGGGDGGGGQNPREADKERTDDCWSFANTVQGLANGAKSIKGFLDKLASTFTESANSSISEMLYPSGVAQPNAYNDSGFKTEFQGSSTPNQVRHYVGAFIAATHGGGVARSYMDSREKTTGRDGGPDRADIALNAVAAQHAGAYINPLFSTIGAVRRELAPAIRRDVCADSPQ